MIQTILYAAAGFVITSLIYKMIFTILSLRRVVPTNEVHIVQSRKKTVTYGKDIDNGNIYYQWPTWVPFIGIEVKSLLVSIFDIKLESYPAYDKDRLPFVVDIVAFFRIKDHAIAAQRVSSVEELEEQLTSIVQGSVRTILAKSEIGKIMEERSEFGAMFTGGGSASVK